MIGTDSMPRLTGAVRLRFDHARGRMLLLYPKRSLALNATALSVLELCTGEHRVRDLVEHLLRVHEGARADIERDVLAFLRALERRRLVTADPVNRRR